MFGSLGGVLMKRVRRWQRIMILSLLAFTVLAPVVFLSDRLKNFSASERNEFVEDLATKQKVRTDDLRLNSLKQEESEPLKEPKPVVYEKKDLDSAVSYSSSSVSNDSIQSGDSGEAISNPKQSENSGNAGYRANLLEINGTYHETEEKENDQLVHHETDSAKFGGKGQTTQTPDRHDEHVLPSTRRAADVMVKEIKDQLIRAKAYLIFAPPGTNAHLVKELRQRMKELERAVGGVNKDSNLSRSAIHKKRAMDLTLSKASRVFPDCPDMAKQLRAMTYNAEEEVRAQKNEARFLMQLAARTTPKGLHCLSMRLTAEYFALPPEKQQLPNQQRVHELDLYHYAVFSDNVLACAVVVNSTVSSAKDPKKIVFHVVTDSLNLPAMTMWFLLNPPGGAVIQIQSIDEFEALSAQYKSTLVKRNSIDPRYTSALNHLRFYLPEVFPLLNKIVLLDHDVVVQKDLTALWSLDMKGKVNGAVETCHESDPSFRRMDLFINFSDPFVSKRFDVKACTWAFGMNLFDLQGWRKQSLIALYHKYLHMGDKRPLWKAGSLPLGWATFYNRTVALDRKWHRPGLGYESGIGRDDVEQAAVLHYDGVMKPWLDIGIGQYKGYWSKYINYDHSYLQQCNIHE